MNDPHQNLGITTGQIIQQRYDIIICRCNDVIEFFSMKINFFTYLSEEKKTVFFPSQKKRASRYIIESYVGAGNGENWKIFGKLTTISNFRGSFRKNCLVHRSRVGTETRRNLKIANELTRERRCGGSAAWWWEERWRHGPSSCTDL